MKQGKISAATVPVALIGVFLCGAGVGLNNCAVCVGPCIQFFNQKFVKLLVKQD